MDAVKRWRGMNFYDPEWEEAENANEKMIYYQQQTKTGTVIRRYKPSLAKLVMERTGWTLIPLKECSARIERNENE